MALLRQKAFRLSRINSDQYIQDGVITLLLHLQKQFAQVRLIQGAYLRDTRVDETTGAIRLPNRIMQRPLGLCRQVQRRGIQTGNASNHAIRGRAAEATIRQLVYRPIKPRL